MIANGYIYGLLRLLNLIGATHECSHYLVDAIYKALALSWPVRRVGVVDVPEEAEVCAGVLLGRIEEFADYDPRDALLALDEVLPRLRAIPGLESRIGNAPSLRHEFAEKAVQDNGRCPSRSSPAPLPDAGGADAES